MAANTRDTADRLPTTGVDAQDLDWLDAIWTGEDALIVYGVDEDDAWIQSDWCISLEQMR